MARETYQFHARDRVLDLGNRTRIIGVVNITPDSFSDGGRFLDRSRAVEQCLKLAEAGADILDLGGESTRPGAQPVPGHEEQERILPVLREVRAHIPGPISIDTYKSSVAHEALLEGADIINDVSAFRLDPQMPSVVSRWEAGVILMHMRGTPRNMQQLPPSQNILAEIQEDLKTALESASEHGIPHDRIMLDPGIGFGKTFEDNLKILNQLSFFNSFQLPILVGTSRKSFLAKILDLPAGQRLMGTAASVVVAIMRGAHAVRVHNVEEILQVVQVTDAVLAEGILE